MMSRVLKIVLKVLGWAVAGILAVVGQFAGIWGQYIEAQC